MKTALTIAGSDPAEAPGIQADIKTMTAIGVYAMSAITALTAQNTTGVYGIMEATPEFLEEQLERVFTDIYPDAVKTGMVSSSALIAVIGKVLRRHQAKNIVVDPVMVSTSGSRLLAEDAVAALKERTAAFVHGVHPQHSGSPGTGRYGRHLPGGNGAGRPAHRGKIWMRCFVQRRPSGEHRRRLPLAEWKGHLDTGPAD